MKFTVKCLLEGAKTEFKGLKSYFLLEPLLVLIEYVPYGDLLGFLRKSRGLNDTYYKDPDIKPETSLTSQQLMKFAWQIADGMSYLSSKSVCNILFTVFFQHFPTLGDTPLYDTNLK